MPTTKKRVGKEEAKSLFLKYYNNSPSSMVRDINTKAKTLKPNAKNSWKYRSNPSKYDMKGVDDNSNAARQWIMNRFFRHMNSIASPKTQNNEQSIASLKAEIENSKTFIKNLNSEIKACQDEKKNSSSQVRSTYNAAIATLKKEVEEQKNIVSTLKESLAANEERIKVLKAEYENNVAQALAKSEQEYSTALNKLKQEHQAAIIQLQAEKQVIDQDLKKLQETLKSQSNEKSTIQTQLAAAKAELGEEKKIIANLELQNKQLRQQGKAISSNIASEMQAKEEAINSHIAKIANLQDRIAKQDQAIAKNQQTITDLTNKLNSELSKSSIFAAQQTEKAKKLSDRINDLQSRLELLKAKRDEIQKSLDKTTSDLTEAKNNIINKATEYNNLEKQLNAKIQELEAQYIAELQSKENLNDIVKSLTQDRRDNEGLIATLRAQIRNLTQSSKETTNETTELKERIQELEMEQTILQQKVANAEKDCAKEASVLKTKLQESDANILQANEKIAQNISNIEAKEKQITELKNHMKELQAKPAAKTVDSQFETLLHFDKVLFNVAGIKGSGSVTIDNFKGDPKLDIKPTDFYMMKLDILENSKVHDLFVSLSKMTVINRYDKTSYEIIPEASKVKGETYKFKIVQPKAMSAEGFKEQIKALNAVFKSSSNYHDSYKLKKNLKI